MFMCSKKKTATWRRRENVYFCFACMAPPNGQYVPDDRHLLLWDTITMRAHYVWSQAWQRWCPTVSWRLLIRQHKMADVSCWCDMDTSPVTAYRMYDGDMRVDQRAVNTFVLTCDVEWKFLASIVPIDVTSIYSTASSDARLRCLRFRGANQHPVTQSTRNLWLVTVFASNKERTDRPTDRRAS